VKAGFCKMALKRKRKPAEAMCRGQSGNALFYAQFHLCVFHKEEQKNRGRGGWMHVINASAIKVINFKRA